MKLAWAVGRVFDRLRMLRWVPESELADQISVSPVEPVLREFPAEPRSLFGIPVVLDANMAPGRFELHQDGRLIHVGELPR